MVERSVLIDYLLHRMPESERLAFAERWFASPEMSAALEAAEAELLDAYVRAELPREQRSGLERYVLNSPEQRRKLAFAATLHQILAGRQRQWPWAVMATAAAILILSGVSLWTGVQNWELRREVAALRSNARPAAGGIYAVSLESTVCGAAERAPIVIPADASAVRLNLELDAGNDAGSYSVALSRSGRVVWKQEPLAPKGGVVSALIPSSVLDPGRYTVALDSGGNAAAYYDLTIARGN